MIVQTVVRLLAGKVLVGTMTALVPDDFGRLCRIRANRSSINIWLDWIVRDGEVLPLAKVCVQSHDDVLNTRKAFQHGAQRAVHV